MLPLSIIIPTYNRAASLRTCLEALTQQTEPADHFEVIVVVDGSTDGTDAMLRELQTPYALRVHTQPNSGQRWALNQGLALARGEFCLFLDDDIVATPQLVAEHLRAQRAHGGVVGLGRLALTLPHRADRFVRHFARLWDEHYGRLDSGARPLRWTDCYSGNMSAPRATLNAVGGFATNLTHAFDIELGYRLEQHGSRFVYVPLALGDQVYDKDWRAVLRDRVREGRIGIELYRRHPAMLPRLALGAWSETTWRVVLLRRVLLALHVPLSLLIYLGALLHKQARAREWYRFIYDLAYWYGVQQATRATPKDRDLWRRATSGTTILMYHAFGKPNEPPSRYIVPARRLKQQMAWLKLLRYHVLGLDEWLRLRQHYQLPPPRSVVITADDGYADNAAVAAPILQRHHFPWTIFLVSAAGHTNQWDDEGELCGRLLLSSAQIAALTRIGVCFGAHTRQHVALTTITPDLATMEIAGSRDDLQHIHGLPITTFAYPYGKHNPTTEALVAQAGFMGACGVELGTNSPRTPAYAVRRIEVRGTYTLRDFASALWLGDTRTPFTGDRR